MTVKIIIQITANMVHYVLELTGQIQVGIPRGKLRNGYSNLLAFLATETTE